MEDKSIKLLYIKSDVHALITINQAPAGETGLSAVTQPIAADSTFFITMLPLQNGSSFMYLPYTRRVCIASKGAVFDNDGLIELCMWPENIVELTLHPLEVYKYDEAELRPTVLSPFDFLVSGERHTAFIYNEAYSSFVVEHTIDSRPKFIAPLSFLIRSAQIGFYKLGDFPLIYATGKTTEDEDFLYVAHILPQFGTDICTVCEAHSFEHDGVYVIENGRFYQKKALWRQSGNELAPVSTTLGWFTCEPRIPTEPAHICTALLEALEADQAQTAMDCLTPSLAEGLSFEDLKEFFGSFTSIAKTLSPACGQGGIALKYAAGKNLYTAREFCVETKKTAGGLLIDNIREP